jgi:hypothetical protein
MSDESGGDRERHIHQAGDRSREATGADRCTRRSPAAAAAIRRESSVARAESPPARAQSVEALPRVHRAPPAAPRPRLRRAATRLPGLGGPERRRRLTPANSGRVGSPQPSRPALPGPRRANTGHSARARPVTECGKRDTPVPRLASAVEARPTGAARRGQSLVSGTEPSNPLPVRPDGLGWCGELLLDPGVCRCRLEPARQADLSREKPSRSRVEVLLAR